MTNPSEKTTITLWGDKAFALMKQHKVELTPANYAIWFEFVTGHNKPLVDEINKAVSAGKPFGTEYCREIYDKFVANEMERKAIEEASARVQQILDAVLNSVGENVEDTKAYSTDLGKYSEELAKGAGGDKIGGIVEKIVSRTATLRKKGEALAERLDSSRREVEILRTNLEEMAVQISLDPLTGVANRKALDDVVKKKIEEAKTLSKPMCFLMVDVDHFKRFNDEHGHLLGDQVLRIVAKAMVESVKGKDFVARYGGEEFCVILPETPLKGGEIVADAIRKNIASKELKRRDTGQSYGQITVSIGVSCCKSTNDTVDSLIGRADSALYEAKRLGRNRVASEQG